MPDDLDTFEVWSEKIIAVKEDWKCPPSAKIFCRGFFVLSDGVCVIMDKKGGANGYFERIGGP